MKSHIPQLKNPEASEYLVLNTFSMVVASMITLYFRINHTAVALISDRMASTMRPTILRQNMARQVIMKFTASITTASDTVSHATPAAPSWLLSMTNRKNGRL